MSTGGEEKRRANREVEVWRLGAWSRIFENLVFPPRTSGPIYIRSRALRSTTSVNIGAIMLHPRIKLYVMYVHLWILHILYQCFYVALPNCQDNRLSTKDASMDNNKLRTFSNEVLICLFTKPEYHVTCVFRATGIVLYRNFDVKFQDIAEAQYQGMRLRLMTLLPALNH